MRRRKTGNAESEQPTAVPVHPAPESRPEIVTESYTAVVLDPTRTLVTYRDTTVVCAPSDLGEVLTGLVSKYEGE